MIVIDFLRKRAQSWRTWWSLVRELVTDVSRYARRRVQRLRASTTDPFEEVLTRVIVDATNELLEAKKHAAVSIADEKALARQIQLAKDTQEEWTRRADMATAAGQPEVAEFARASARFQAEQTAANELLWARQVASVTALKASLRQLNDRIELAKLDRQRILVAHALACDEEHSSEVVREMEETVRRLDRLSRLGTQVAGEKDRGEE